MARISRPGTPQFSRTERGRAVYAATTRWVHARMGVGGLRQYLMRRRDLEHYGNTKENAVGELMPRIPEAHVWYAEHGYSGRVFETREAFWSGYLADRVHHWFNATTPKSGRRMSGRWSTANGPGVSSHFCRSRRENFVTATAGTWVSDPGYRPGKRREPTGRWILTTVNPDRKDIETQTFGPDTEAEAGAWIDGYIGRWNLCFSVNRPARPIPPVVIETEAWPHFQTTTGRPSRPDPAQRHAPSMRSAEARALRQ